MTRETIPGPLSGPYPSGTEQAMLEAGAKVVSFDLTHSPNSISRKQQHVVLKSILNLCISVLKRGVKEHFRPGLGSTGTECNADG